MHSIIYLPECKSMLKCPFFSSKGFNEIWSLVLVKCLTTYHMTWKQPNKSFPNYCSWQITVNKPYAIIYSRVQGINNFSAVKKTIKSRITLALAFTYTTWFFRSSVLKKFVKTTQSVLQCPYCHYYCDQ